MPVVFDQLIILEWSSKIKNYYVNKGYNFTFYGDKFNVKIDDLPRSSKFEVEIICDFCGERSMKKISSIRDLNSICCNDKCRKMKDRKRTKFTCPICTTEFERNDTQIKKNKLGILYCSHECANRVDRKDPTKHGVHNCEYCNEEYSYQLSTYNRYPTRFCSVPCRNKWESENKRGINHPCFKAEEMPCDYCGELNFVTQARIASQDHHFCNTECRQKWYSEIWSQRDEWREEARIRAVKMISDGTFNKSDSDCQKLVDNMLDELQIKNEKEYNCKYYAVDNFLPDYNLMIEVMGSFWHCDPRIYLKIGYKNQIDRIIADKRKNSYIKKKYNIRVLYLWEEDIKCEPDLCKLLISRYIESKGNLSEYHSMNYAMLEGKLMVDKRFVPYFYIDKQEIDQLTELKDKSINISRKQMDKWITFNCDFCGDEKDQLISHHNKNKTHCCSKKCAYELKKQNNKNAE